MNEELEQLLRQSGGEPGERLRGRVLLAVRTELRTSSAARRWRNLAAMAAMAVLWMHATWSAALNVRIDTPAASATELARTAEQIQNLLPDLSAVETRRMALQLNAGTGRPRWAVARRGDPR